MRRVLVTGAAGFIGSHLVEALVKRGDGVRAFIRYNSSNTWGWIDTFPPEIRERIEIVRGDLKDAFAVRAACAGIDVVFHLGALIAIPYSYVHPNDFVQTNVVGTANVLQGAMAEGVKRVVHTSTSEVYGTARRVPIAEDHPLQAQSPYAATKMAADKLAESFQCAFNLAVVTVRPFNTYGPRQSARAVIPTIIAQALTGDAVKLGSLTPVRDLTYVDDTVRGFLLAAERPKAAGQVLNLGTGVGVSIGDLARRIFAIIGCTPRIVSEKRRVRPAKSEVLKLISDPRLAKKSLGWIARVPLDEGLRMTVEWVRANLDRYKPEAYNL